MSTLAIPMVTLNNGVEIPQVGLGVFQAKPGAETERAVRAALETGYRLIDTAAAYGNEESVGKAIKASGVPREDIFVTTKLWNANHAYDDALRAFDASMRTLDCSYLDLYLIHWPLPMEHRFTEAWRALEHLYDEQRVRAIGVSNFKPQHLDTAAQRRNHGAGGQPDRAAPAVSAARHPGILQRPYHHGRVL